MKPWRKHVYRIGTEEHLNVQGPDESKSIEFQKKLKVFRLEAVCAGFKKAWQERDYAVIVTVADKIPNNVPEEDPKLLMWYDQAVTRMGGE